MAQWLRNTAVELDEDKEEEETRTPKLHTTANCN
jgi:hypothetical protein